MTFAARPEDTQPRAKEAMPPLDTRAPRPPVVRLRRSVVTAAVMAASGLLAGSLAWTFVVQPQLRAEALHRKAAERTTDARGAVRPSELVTDQPADYAHLDQLPPPRQLGRGNPTGTEPKPTASQTPPAPAHAAGQSVISQARGSGLFFPASAGGGTHDEGAGAGAAQNGASRDYGAVYNPHGLLAPLSPYEVKAGSIIPAALISGVDTARPGPVVATVTQGVYDTVSGRTLVIPQGSRLIGRHEGESRHGDKRAFLIWDRLILPNGKSLVLTHEDGVDAEGAVGVPGRVDRRLGALAVATLFAGAITTLGQAARDHDNHSGGLLGDAGDAAAIEAAQVGGKLIDRELDVRPSIRLRPGARVQVLVTRDLILEPYQP